MRTTILAGLGVGACLLAGCAGNHERVGAMLPGGGAVAVAPLVASDGRQVGRATATAVQGGMRMTIDARGLPPGTHGAHIHTTGRCDLPDFASAGGHWNPTGTHHGTNNPAGPHRGDLPNLVVGADGHGTLGVNVPDATMAGLLDADGAALVIHADADDLMTDPSGNSGGRIACGVFAPA